MPIFDPDACFPINACRREIAAGWEFLKTPCSFATFEAHVLRQHPAPDNCHKYLPSFVIPDEHAPAWDRYTKAAKRDQIAALEAALAYCIAAKAIVTKPTAELLANARMKRRLFDALLAAEELASEKRRDARVKGGTKRQERLRPAREYALRLFRSMSPDGGWKNTSEAARTIYPHVKEFVIRNRLALVPGDSLVRTIRGWLRPASGTSA